MDRQAEAQSRDSEPAALESQAEPSAPTQEQEQAAPVNLSEVLRRVGAGSLLEEAELPEPPEAKQETAIAPPQPTVVAQSPQEVRRAATQHEGDEESINDYMARLMERVRATSGGVESSAYGGQSLAASPAPEPPRAVEEKPIEENPIEAPAAAPAPTLRSRREDADAGPRAVAPERQAGLAAMRELANLSAHNALSKHARRQMILTIRTKLLTMGLGLAAGGAMVWLWRQPGANVLTIYGAAASFVVALVWGIEYAVMSGRLIVGKAGKMEWKGGKPSSPQQAAPEPQKPSTSSARAES